MAKMGEHYFGITDKGRVRDNNEDAFLVEEFVSNSSVLACVIDGVGGYEGGEIAAAIARDSIAELLTAPNPVGPEILREAIHVANQRIIDAKQAHPGGGKMACVLTMAVADIEGNQFHYAHVGDTRLYLLRGNSLIKVTKDHSFVGFLEDSSRITEENAMRHPKRNEISKALGFDPNISKQQDYVETGSSPFLPGDMLLLCSDGLTDMVGSREITNVLTSSESLAGKAQALIDAANKAGGKDNITAVIVQNNKVRAAQEPAIPIAPRRSEQPSSGGAATKVVEQREEPPRRKGGSPLVWVLALLCAGLATTLAWRHYGFRNADVASNTPGPAVEQPAVIRQRNAHEQRLLDSLNYSGGVIVMDSAMAGSPVVITDSILIQRDSIWLNGNGLVLRPDSAFKGPALVLSDSTKYVFLENMVFENFTTGIVAKGNALQLSNVRFANCANPITYQMRVPGRSTVTGIVNPVLFSKPDSLTGKQTPWQ